MDVEHICDCVDTCISVTWMQHARWSQSILECNDAAILTSSSRVTTYACPYLASLAQNMTRPAAERTFLGSPAAILWTLGLVHIFIFRILIWKEGHQLWRTKWRIQWYTHKKRSRPVTKAKISRPATQERIRRPDAQLVTYRGSLLCTHESQGEIPNSSRRKTINCLFYKS